MDGSPMQPMWITFDSHHGDIVYSIQFTKNKSSELFVNKACINICPYLFSL